MALFDYVLFAFSLKFIDVAVATVLVGIAPIFVAVFMGQLFKEEKRYNTITTEKWFLFLLAFLGCVFVIISQSQNIDNAVRELLTYTSLTGVVLVLLSALWSGFGPPCSVKWGADIADKVINGGNATPAMRTENEQFFTVVADTMGRMLSVVIFIVLGVFSGEQLGNLGFVGITSAAVYGLFGIGIGNMLFRFANLKTKNLGINALSYARPGVALIWLALASLIIIPHVDWLIIGVVAVITANLLINFEASIRLAYKSLIIALWVCGMWVYLHTSFSVPDYFVTVEIASVLFILLLSFRMDRLVRRTTDEENKMLGLLRKCTTLTDKGKISADIPKLLRMIDSHKTVKELHDAYSKIKAALPEAHRHEPEMVDEIEIELDQIAHSKQQGINFGELTALGFIGGILVLTLLLFEPNNLAGWNGFLVEVSSFILATVILFLFINVLDIQSDRTRPTVEFTKTPNPHYSIIFRDATNRGFERSVSVIVCLAITLSYGWLFFGKWL